MIKDCHSLAKCLLCGGVGHKARRCTTRCDGQSSPVVALVAAPGGRGGDKRVMEAPALCGRGWCVPPPSRAHVGDGGDGQRPHPDGGAGNADGSLSQGGSRRGSAGFHDALHITGKMLIGGLKIVAGMA